ncbi:MAG: hypothetical protein ABSC51_04880 [Gaiellaceae bacterium]|jgi:hypothetical protein
MLDMPLGTLIFRAGLIAPQQLEDALAEGLRSGKRLGEVLLARGWLSEEDLSRLLAGQKGLSYADVEKTAIDRELAGAMSYEDARREMAMPLVTEFGVPVVAICDPDEDAMERLRVQLGPEIRFVIAAPSALARRIDEVLGGVPSVGLNAAPSEPGQTLPEAPTVEPIPAEAEPAAVAEEVLPESAPAPEQQAPEEVASIIGEGEIDYPTFPNFEPMPTPEPLGAPLEQLPEDVQMGEYGYFGDTSLLEGGAWQTGEPGSGASEQIPEEAPPPVEEQAGDEAEQAGPESEPLSASSSEEITPEQPGEDAVDATPVEEEPRATPAWMRGEATVITAEVADFMGPGEPGGYEPVAAEPVENSERAAAEPSEGKGEIVDEPTAGAGPTEPEYQEQYEAPEADLVAEQPVEPGSAAAAETGRGEYELVLRLSNGDQVPIGAYASNEEAQAQAGEIVRQVSDVKEGGWPFIGGRYLRPDTIVSIDVEYHSAGWSGSGNRGRSFSGDENDQNP